MKNKLFYYVVIIALLICNISCDIVTKNIQKSDLKLLANNLKLSYKFMEVREGTNCLPDKSLEQCYIFQLSLTMPIRFNEKGWQIYFSQKNPVIKTESREFTIEKINGDLHRLYAKEQFKGFEQEKTIQIVLITKAVQLEDALLQPNFYVMSESLMATVIKSSLLK